MINKYDIFKDNNLNCYQIRTKSNSFMLEFDEKEKEDIFLKIVDEINKNSEISFRELNSILKKNYDKPKIMEVLFILNEYKLIPLEMSIELNKEDDTFAPLYNALNKELSDYSISIIGESLLSDKILSLAKNENFKDVNLQSFSSDEKIENIIKDSDFLIVDANRWSPYHLELINKIALKHQKPWLYVGGIEEMSIKIGPLFYGDETGCYNCLIARIKSNHEYPEYLISYENHLKEKKISSKPDYFFEEDILYNIIANMTLLEVKKFIMQWSIPSTWRTIIKIDIDSFDLDKHSLLKKPFCEVCKPKLEYNPAPWLESITLK